MERRRFLASLLGLLVLPKLIKAAQPNYVRRNDKKVGLMRKTSTWDDKKLIHQYPLTFQECFWDLNTYGMCAWDKNGNRIDPRTIL